jgi:hypothetical protein
MSVGASGREQELRHVIGRGLFRTRHLLGRATGYDARIAGATGNESFMWNWVRRLEWTRRPAVRVSAPTIERQVAKVSGKVASKYAPLHKYLVNRYADTVVLTFAQLEDLTGGPLPDSAHSQQEWWTNTKSGADKSSCADAWILAGRTAQANLMARTVVFERSTDAFETRPL